MPSFIRRDDRPPRDGEGASVRRIFAGVEEVTQKVVPVYVNCQNDATRFAV